MRDKVVDQNSEFEELVGSLSQTINQVSDPVAIGAMLFQIAQERKNTNLIISELNAKMDGLMEKIKTLESEPQTQKPHTGLSDKDMEVLNYVKEKGRVSAEQMQKKFKYKGKNAASARLSKLFHDGVLEKEYLGRNVIYKVK